MVDPDHPTMPRRSPPPRRSASFPCWSMANRKCSMRPDHRAPGAHESLRTSADPERRGRGDRRMIDRVFDNYVMTPMNEIVVAQFRRRDARSRRGRVRARRARQSYTWIDRWLAGHDRGDAIGLIECAAAPALFYADGSTRSRASAIACANGARACSRPPIARCVDDAQPRIAISSRPRA